MVEEDEETWTKISSWLPVLGTSPDMAHSFAIQQKEEGTCKWIIEHQQVNDWVESPGSLCVVEGDPGVGKTILCASVIEHLKSTGSPIGFFYFDFRNAAEQDCSRLLGSLIIQLAQCPDNATQPTSLRELDQGLHKEPASPELERVLQNTCDSLAHPYIILDAYDECGSDTQYSVLRLIMHLTVEHGVRVLVFTRPGLQLGLRSVLRAAAKYFVNLKEEKANLEKDIEEYLRQRVERERQLHRWDPRTSQIVMDKLVADSSKGFFWIRCQLDSLSRCLDPHSLSLVLTSAPRNLTAMYDHILRQIQSGVRENIYQVLAWVSHSERLLTLQELALIFSLRPWGASRALIIDRTMMRVALLDPQSIIALLSGLLSSYPIAYPYAEGELSRTGVRVTHVSVKEFLKEEGHKYTFMNYSLSPNDAHRFIADASLAIMKNWLALRTERGQNMMGNSTDVGQLATVFDLAWPI